MKKQILGAGLLALSLSAHAYEYPNMHIERTSELPSSLQANESFDVYFKLTSVNNVYRSAFAWVLPSNASITSLYGECPEIQPSVRELSAGATCTIRLTLKAPQNSAVEGHFGLHVTGSHGPLDHHRWDYYFNGAEFNIQVN